MKKLSIFLLGALAIAATSCEEDPDFGATIQTNPQGPVFEVEGVSVAQPAETSISLKDYADASKDVALGDFTLADFPEGYDLKVVTYISKDETFATQREVPSKVVENVVYATAQDLQDAYFASVSKAPSEKPVYVRFVAYATNGEQDYRIGAEDSYLGSYSFNITPFPSSIVLEDSYYLIGTANDWSVATAIKFNHSDLSPYDDPFFTLVVDITPEQADAGWWWKILPGSTVEAGKWVSAEWAQWGPEENGSEDLSGMLMASKLVDGKLVEPGAGVITEYGTFMITLDMVEGTYNFSLAIPNLFVQGDAAGWNWDSPLVATMTTTDYVNYIGFAKVSTGGYKFTSEKSWSAAFNLGVDGKVAIDETTHKVTGKLANGSNNNVMPDVDGLFFHNVNITSLDFTSTYITTLGLIGSATPGGWDASTALNPSQDYLVWEGDVDFADGEFKIRANDAWDVDFGGSLDNLVYKGANIASPGAGKKHVTLDLSKVPYTLTIE
ncbi:MAG: hypothetical protein PUD39_08955 [Bacteroidales bacterium]|nr:hypothetical protein [Bacteroidales bacterium]